MPPGLQTVTFFKQGLTGGAFEALAPAAGDSATFFNVPQGSPAYLAEVWAVDSANVCEIEMTATRFHDQVAGIRLAVPSGAALAPTTRPSLISPPGYDQPIYPSDVLAILANGTAADNVNVTLVLFYSDIPGINARLATPSAVKGLLKNIVGIRVSPTSGAGTYGATVALNSVDNRLHADTYYAVLGFTCQTPCASVVIQGIDTGNLRVGGPVLAAPEHDAYLFADLADKYGQALIPIINSNNAGSTTIACAHTSAAAKVIDVVLGELTGPPGF